MKLSNAMMHMPEGDQHGAPLFAAVREGLSPFKANQIYSYVEYDIDYHRYWIYFEVVYKGGYRLAHKESFDAWDFDADPVSETTRLAVLMLHAFRNREDFYDLPNGIHLGEN